MKAWIVSDAHGEYGSEIVYAETSGRAKSLFTEWIRGFVKKYFTGADMLGGDSE